MSHSKHDNSKSADQSTTGGTKLITLDNLSTNDILSTAAASTDSNIRIKTVESLNKMVHKNSTANPTKSINSTKDKHDTSSRKAHGWRADETGSQQNVLKASAVGVPSSVPIDSIIKSTASGTASSKTSHASNQKTNFAINKSHTQSKSHIEKPVTTALSSHQVEEISSDSDDVEFVSEIHLKKSKNQMHNVIKHIKTSNNSSRSSSPNSQAQAQSTLLRRRRDSSIDGKEELDVKQIMEAIKELQVRFFIQKFFLKNSILMRMLLSFVETLL